jgi:predicted AAA+ superfamily ATPase
LLQIIEYIKTNLNKDDIIFIDKENLKRDHIKTYIDLYNETRNYKYIFIDEIQNIENWEKAVLSLQNE